MTLVPVALQAVQVVGWLSLAAVGFALALRASNKVADNATALVRATNLSPFVVGVVVLAVGTDLPEIVNSIITSAAGHGDLNVGDSVGSALTQLTLVLGLLPFFGGIARTDSRAIQTVGGFTVAALLGGVLLLGDGSISRVDAALLIVAWIAALFFSRDVAMSRGPEASGPAPEGKLRLLGSAAGALVVVGIGASLAVLAMIRIAVALSVPEYAVSFFGASLGTSLPELFVNVTAMRRGATGLAMGGVFGASLVDATLSIGVGPLLFPVAVTATDVVRGGLYAAVAIALVTLLLGRVRHHSRSTGLVLLALYVAAYLVILR